MDGIYPCITALSQVALILNIRRCDPLRLFPADPGLLVTLSSQAQISDGQEDQEELDVDHVSLPNLQVATSDTYAPWSGGVVHVPREAFVRTAAFVLDAQGKAVSLPSKGNSDTQQSTQDSSVSNHDQLGLEVVRIFQLRQAVSVPHPVNPRNQSWS